MTAILFSAELRPLIDNGLFLGVAARREPLGVLMDRLLSERGRLHQTIPNSSWLFGALLHGPDHFSGGPAACRPSPPPSISAILMSGRKRLIVPMTRTHLRRSNSAKECRPRVQCAGAVSPGGHPVGQHLARNYGRSTALPAKGASMRSNALSSLIGCTFILASTMARAPGRGDGSCGSSSEMQIC